jgi:tetratricopeptide (TPR) repeat protein
MMRKLFFLLLFLALVAAALLLLRYPKGPPWSTESEAALEAFEAGLDADMKLYADDARAHYTRALELDPDFLVAKERLGRVVGGERRRQLLEDLQQADLSTVTPRERFLIRYWRAQMEGATEEGEAAEEILAERLRRAPDDPFALHQAAYQARSVGRLDQAAAYNRRLIEVDPNWVYAQNMLGYLAMAEGDFEEAEERFRTYQYLAPDQANPHDSMGELLLLRGRWEEAEQELEMALAVRPNFVASYNNLLWIALFEQDAGKAQAILGRVETNPDFAPANDAEYEKPEESPDGGTPDYASSSAARRLSFPEHLICLRDVHLGYLTGDWQQAWERASPCLGHAAHAMTAHQVSLALGERERAADMRRTYQETAEREFGEREPNDYFRARFLHMDGNALLAAGEPRRAAEHFRRADELLLFDGNYQALFKLLNLGHHAAALEAAGEPSGARAWRRVEEINPRIRPFLEAGLRPLLVVGEATASGD